jgi:hypothetical protein
MSFKRELLRSIPYYLWVQHILPYTYSPQCQEILHDIRNYKTSYNEALQTYTPFRNRTDRQLFKLELQYFCNNSIDTNPPYLETSFSPTRCYNDVYRRVFMPTHLSKNQVNTIVYRKMFSRGGYNPGSIWGLLTPTERTRFFNEYIITEN